MKSITALPTLPPLLNPGAIFDIRLAINASKPFPYQPIVLEMVFQEMQPPAVMERLYPSLLLY